MTGSMYTPKVISIGRLEKEKRYDLAIEVMKEVMKTIPCEYHIYGIGSQMKKLEKLTEGYPIYLKGWTEQRKIMRTYDCFLHTALFEGYGLVFVEAMICECPIVTTKVGLAKSDWWCSPTCEPVDYKKWWQFWKPKENIDCLVKNVIRCLQGKQNAGDLVANFARSEDGKYSGLAKF